MTAADGVPARPDPVARLGLIGLGGFAARVLTALAQSAQGRQWRRIAINTDAASLQQTPADIRLLLQPERPLTPEGTPRGPQTWQAVQQHLLDHPDGFHKALQGLRAVRVVVGLGAPTGTGALLACNALLRDLGLDQRRDWELRGSVDAVLPFDFEGPDRSARAQFAVRALGAAGVRADRGCVTGC